MGGTDPTQEGGPARPVLRIKTPKPRREDIGSDDEEGLEAFQGCVEKCHTTAAAALKPKCQPTICSPPKKMLGFVGLLLFVGVYLLGMGFRTGNAELAWFGALVMVANMAFTGIVML